MYTFTRLTFTRCITSTKRDASTWRLKVKKRLSTLYRQGSFTMLHQKQTATTRSAVVCAMYFLWVQELCERLNRRCMTISCFINITRLRHQHEIVKKSQILLDYISPFIQGRSLGAASPVHTHSHGTGVYRQTRTPRRATSTRYTSFNPHLCEIRKTRGPSGEFD
jgi:hypothetical protein